MEKQYKAYIDNIHYSIELEDIELCTFITHFGQFGNIELYDQKKGELVLNTVGILLLFRGKLKRHYKKYPG